MVGWIAALRRFFKTVEEKCPGCGGKPFKNPFTRPYCNDCFSDLVRKRERENEAEAREERIAELTEALRRAFPNGPYRQ